MSKSIILLDQNFNANSVDIMVFEPSVLFPPAEVGGGIHDTVQNFGVRTFLHMQFQRMQIQPFPC